MYTYSKDGKVRQLRGESDKKDDQACSRQTVRYEKMFDKYNWIKWILLFLIISLGAYLMCTSGKKSKRIK